MASHQVTLRGPADIQGSVCLRGEEDAWWGKAESSLLGAVLAAGGHPDASADEFFFQACSARDSTAPCSGFLEAQFKRRSPAQLSVCKCSKEVTLLKSLPSAQGHTSDQDEEVAHDVVQSAY